MEIIEINNLQKVSFNVYNNLHWVFKQKFKDNLQIALLTASRKKYKGAYDLNFEFWFTGKKLDTINVVHYCKKIEDYFFDQDNLNRTICITVDKGEKNKCILTLKKFNK